VLPPQNWGGVIGIIQPIFASAMSVRVTIFQDNKKYPDSLSVLIDGSLGFSLAGAFEDGTNAVKKKV